MGICKPCNYLRHDPSVANLLRRPRRHSESSQFIRSHLMPICCIAARTTTQTTLRERKPRPHLSAPHSPAISLAQISSTSSILSSQ